jgi:hypothetical protein
VTADGPALVTHVRRVHAVPSPAASVTPAALTSSVWLRCRELAASGGPFDVSGQALVLRADGHDADALARALCLGRSQARHPAGDDATRRGIRILERALADLGHPAAPDPRG